MGGGSGWVLVCARERPGRALNDRREKCAWKPLGSVFLLHNPDLEPSQMAPSGTVGLVLGAGPAGVRLAADARGFGRRTRVARHNLPSREPPGGAHGQVRLVRGRRQLPGLTNTGS